MGDITAKQALESWRRAGLLSADQAAALAAHLDTQAAPTAARGRGVTIFASLGALLVGLGILLFVASNWQELGPLARAAVLAVIYAAAVGSTLRAEVRGHHRVARALCFLTTITFGATIFFLGQIFHFTLTYWQGTFVWLIGTLAMGYAIESRLHAWVAVPLALLTLGWVGGGSGWFFDDQYEFLWSKAGLRPLLPALGLALVALSMLAQRTRWRFASGAWLGWGACLAAVPLALSTASTEVPELLFTIAMTPTQIATLIGSGVLVVAAACLATQCAPPYRLFLVALFAAILFALCTETGTVLDNGFSLIVYVAAMFSLALITVWVGVGAARPLLVNIGIGAATLIVAIQYVSWSLRLLDRSLAFVAGGIVLLLLSVVIERKRRQLVEEIAR